MGVRGMSSTFDGIIEVLSQPSARDKQRRIGPSELGDLCERCLAEKLLGVHKDDDRGTPFAPMLGTALHAYLERMVDENTWEMETETSVTVGEIKGYGRISGTVDCFDRERGHVIDYKLLSRRKIKAFSSATYFGDDGSVEFYANAAIGSQLKKYYYQMQLYGKGLEDVGFDVSHTSLVLFPRDCTTETLHEAAHELCFVYDRSAAEAVLERAGAIYAWAVENRDSLDELDSDPGCYYCRFKRI